MNQRFDFAWAIRLLKEGKRVCRSGWNGKGMWLVLVRSDEWTYGCSVPDALLPFIAMKTADERLVPWLASQTDMLADDWQVVMTVHVKPESLPPRQWVKLPLWEWTPEREDEVRWRWTAGESFSDIARALGDGCTRSMVAGKARRLGLLGTRPKPQPQPAEAKPAVVRRAPPKARADLPKPVEVPAPDPSPPPAPGQGVPLLALRVTSCRWPLWANHERAGLYCGAVRLVGSSYCPHHTRIAAAPRVR